MPYYRTKDGISFGEVCPFEEEVNRGYAKAEKGTNRIDVIKKVKKQVGFPQEVSYVAPFKNQPACLHIEAPSSEEAKKIIINNKEKIERLCNLKITDELKLEDF